MQFVDIAGLVKGASQGEGLGNQFLAHIRETDAIVHVVRCFEDPNVTHVMGGVDPVRDREMIDFELALADLQSVEKRLDKSKKSVRSGDKESSPKSRCSSASSRGSPRASRPGSPTSTRRTRRCWRASASSPPSRCSTSRTSRSRTSRPARTRHVAKLRERGRRRSGRGVPVCAKIEAELAELAPDERAVFLAELGLEEPGLDRLIRAGYQLLGLRTYFTAGEVEVRAWTIRAGATAPEAAGVIHTDFEQHFIRAETVGWSDYERLGSVKAAKDQGLLRSEGKDHTVADGDILNILHSG